MEISLKALGLSQGDEVIVPSNTFIATWLAVSNVGAIPIPVEPYEHNYSINVSKIQDAISHKTKAIIPVHLYGQPAAMDKILEIAQKNSLFVIEDAAQAHGACFKGKELVRMEMLLPGVFIQVKTWELLEMLELLLLTINH